MILRHNGFMDSVDEQPRGYSEPEFAWLVEYADPRQPGERSFQLGAFTSESEAQRLKAQYEDDGFFAELRLNMVPVHRRVEDWLWDR